jgi:hypothetical protein
MKTAMQELKDWANQYKGQMISADQVVLQAHKLLKKEKEQIMKANMDGYKEGCTFHSFGHRPLTTEQYYNQTYNQTNVGNDGFEFDNSSTIPPPKTNNL